MALRKVGITSAECSPVRSLETLGKNRSASDFSVIRQKGNGAHPGAAGKVEARHSGCHHEHSGKSMDS